MGFEPTTTTKPNNLRNGRLPMRQIISYVIKPTILNILHGIMAHKGEGWGPSSNPWSCKPPYEDFRGRTHGIRGLCPIFNYKVVFLTNFWVLIVIKPMFNGFSPFLGVIGHLWSLNFRRKLEVRNQLPIYITQACLRPYEGIQSRVMLKRSQAKAILRQRSF
jgi:hypothetical protein